ncbi:endonuclease/exonuclease/phosphatase family protein [Botrimarina mediterranea]|uniref:Endonuclease/Exonuclease/phosphatase family protein n=1 Tax=Botrimarina mediterranea TaxID=2528022 RepID=A0A518KEB6_9BACT|nr:endonuclease/exonuclease/phosphatase family protein [Botrimarina mediterranea]QDV76132.1 Endonuclease/Exonuclease/phosphatase family protein [Botrimarina mediterranea]
MQRIVSLGLLAALVGGGWTALQNVGPQQLQQAVQSVRTTVGPMLAQQPGQQQSAPQPAPTTPQQNPYAGGYNYTPVGGAAQFAPPPVVQEPPSIRIASFNIQVFGDAKAEKPYVMRALAHIVKSFDVIAIQEIRTQDTNFIPRFLRDYVNVGVTSGGYDSRVSPRLGRTSSKEQYAFIFNTATIEVHPRFCAVVPDPEDRLHREPFAALFKTRIVPPYTPFTFTLINIHTDPDEVPEELDALYYVYDQVRRSQIDGGVEDDVILLGDLNTPVPAASRWTPDAEQRSITPRDLGLLGTIPNIAPLIRREATNTRGTRLYDNILIPRQNTVEYLDHGVMDLRSTYQLSEEQVLEISDHLPVWGKFSAIEGGPYQSASR